jgi:DNA polymerase/3'-5' exonuclease PolX
MDHEFAQGEKFKGGSYKKVLPALKKLSSDYELSVENLKRINGLGKGLLEKIEVRLNKDTNDHHLDIISRWVW